MLTQMISTNNYQINLFLERLTHNQFFLTQSKYLLSYIVQYNAGLHLYCTAKLVVLPDSTFINWQRNYSKNPSTNTTVNAH